MLDEPQESADNSVPLANRNEASRWPLIVALAAGAVTALLSICLDLSAPSFIGVTGSIITAVIFPGLLGSMAISGNAHAFSLWIAAGINCTFYFLLVWMICIIARLVLRGFR